MFAQPHNSQHSLEHERRTPVVTVIVPAYKTGPYIGDTLKSIAAQTYSDYEVIVVNDGAPDTEEIERALEPYSQHITYIKQENRGLSGARNTALRRARGKYVALLDSDDMWLPEYLAEQVAAMEADPNITVLYPNAVLFGDPATDGLTFMDLCPSEGEVTFESLILQRCTVFISVIARRDALIAAGMFDESLRSSEDFDMWLRVLKNGGWITYHRRPLARSRRRPDSLSADPVWMCQHILRVLDKAGENLKLTTEERNILKLARTRFHAMLRMEEGKRAFLQGDVQGAISGLREANAFFESRKTGFVLFLLKTVPGLLRLTYLVRDRLTARTLKRASQI
jgi:glycosyltransferase involved in cell wall biosynthesis